jgi:hypothetical protein
MGNRFRRRARPAKLWMLRPNPAFNRTPRRRGLMPRLAAVAAGSRLTSSCWASTSRDVVC